MRPPVVEEESAPAGASADTAGLRATPPPVVSVRARPASADGAPPQLPRRVPGVSSESSGRRLVLLQFALCTAALLAVLGTVGAVAMRQIATTEAIRDAKVLTDALGRAVVAPRLTPALLAGDPRAGAALDQAVRDRVLDDDLVRIKVWTPDGTVVYSDLRELVGRKLPVSDDLREAFSDAQTHAEVSDLSQPENRFERGQGKLVEVYLPLTSSDGRPVVVEAYHRAHGIQDSAHRIWRSFLPVLLAMLFALALAQLPLAWFLTRRVRAQERERDTLARRGHEALESERRRIAAALHDGVVQDLAGAAYELDAGAGRALTGPSEATPQDFARVMRRSALLCRQSIITLRALLTDLFPGDSPDRDLAGAIDGLARPLRARGVDVAVDVGAEELNGEVGQLVFRVVREALRNVDHHAGARSVHVTVQTDDDAVALIVADDGCGMTSEVLDQQRADGHMGLALLADSIAARGGDFLVESEPGAGTQLTVELPLR